MEMEAFDVSKVEAALESNRTLQKSIQEALRLVREEKARNRQQAASVIDRILASRREIGSESAKKDSRSFHSSDWRRRFFSYGSDRAPTLYDRGPNDDFFRQFHPPWDMRESKELGKTVKSAIEVGFPIEERYERVASAMKMPKHGVKRNPQECKVEFQRQSEKPLTKEEQKRLIAVVDQSRGEHEDIDWALVAQTLSENRPVPCSPFQCLAAYHKYNQGNAKKRKNITSWTPEEDTLLLKFMLAAGPQILLDPRHPFVHYTLPVELFPEKTKKQILDRIHGSSLNPKLAEGEWTDFEERKLTVLMKIYGGDVVLASRHMNRALKAVSDKWQRTLNPEYATGPFSKEEDAKLVAVIRSQPQLGWRDISRDHFPDRHPQRLMNRWSDLATNEDIIAREQNSRKRSKREKIKRF